MKLKSVCIVNMHQISATRPTEYNLKDISYFVGPNGAGKSTVLQAIQLALLGYIPGYDKTNSAILKHSNDGKFLEVTVALEHNDSIYTVCRRWEKSGNSAKSNLKCTPIGFDPASIIGNIELPVFNFNEFKDMTANKLKEWFIGFLPKDEFAIDWKEYLTSELGSRSALLSDELMEKVLGIISELDAQGKKGVDLVSSLNEQLKSQQSFEKATIERLQSTINSMIYYQEAEDLDRESIQQQLTKLRELRDKVIAYNAQQSAVASTQQKLALIKLDADSADADPEVIRLTGELDTANKEYLAAEANYNSSLSGEYAAKSAELNQLGTISSDICPYTKVKCAEISSRLAEITEKRAQITAQLIELKSAISDADIKRQQLKQRCDVINRGIAVIREKYRTAEVLKSSLPAEMLSIPTAMTTAEIDVKINELNDQLIKIAANKQFTELNETITKDKYRAENNLEVLKMWISSTGANGLQTYMMEKPFETLATDLSTYLTEMYGHEVLGSFRLEEKANSFAFGMKHSDTNNFVEFDLLSSGEKCLFTVALIMCLINRANAELKLILADDMFDHLDDMNADRFFAGLSSKGIQCIMAGVKECKNKDICIAIEGE